MRLLLFCLMLLVCAAVRTDAQDAYPEKVRGYIKKYYPFAIAEQKKTGIPACITLAQGIHETDAGRSELMTKANNHFGIKCKNDWKGETYTYSDDKPNECFKKYKSAEESYRDHSEHLKNNPRYASLFALSKTDYAAWAIGLKKGGYATNPQYSAKLIKIIEDYRLQDFTYLALEEGGAKDFYPVEDPLEIVEPQQTVGNNGIRQLADSARKTIMNKEESMHPPAKDKVENKPIFEPEAKPDKQSEFDTGIFELNGIKAFYAYKGEMLLKYAVKYKIRYARLLEINDLPDAPLPDDMAVYLEKKKLTGSHPKHLVKEGETMQLISQREGVVLKRLYELNKIEPNEEPATGATLELQSPAMGKPEVYTVSSKKKTVDKRELNSLKKGNDSNDLIAVKHVPKPETKELKEKEEIAEPPASGKLGTRQAPVMKEDTLQEDLSGLKAELDKVVYSDKKKAENAKKVAHPEEPPAKYIDDAPEEKNVVPNKEIKSKKNEQTKGKKPHKPKMYEVRKGDNLSHIAQKFHVTVKQIRQWNHIKGENIREGKEIRVGE